MTGLQLANNNFNPRSPHGERPERSPLIFSSRTISIHAPRTGSDQLHSTRTPPRRDISIHAPRTGSDRVRPGGTEEQKYFNPRSPHGERRNPTGSGISERHFNPRSPHGERPALTAAVSSGEKFQSTLPARGATLRADGSKSGYTHFNPRSPHGERQVILIVWACASLFQSTLPARGATHQGVLCRCKVRKISIHAPRTGSDLRWLRTARRSLYFNPRSPHGERLLCVYDKSQNINFNPRSPHGERPHQGRRDL